MPRNDRKRQSRVPSVDGLELRIAPTLVGIPAAETQGMVLPGTNNSSNNDSQPENGGPITNGVRG
jgi:hypothetical protein